VSDIIITWVKEDTVTVSYKGDYLFHFTGSDIREEKVLRELIRHLGFTVEDVYD
jgi:hypothetical protein